MSSFSLPNENQLSSLKGKVVVLTGGANGIGASTIQLLHSHGASIIFGDVDVSRGTALASSLGSNVHFLPTDVTSYSSLLSLFDLALNTYNRIDIAISNAGIVERPGWFEPSISLDDIKKPPSTAVLDINLTGTLYFARIAAVYLRQNFQQGDDKSLILLSSVAGFEESPGLFVYQAAKHGVLGLMRSLRQYFPTAYGEKKIRVNCVCPWATDTVMIQTFRDEWVKQGLPLNSTDGVARVITGLTVGEVSGESVYVEGNRGWMIEEGLQRTHPEWLGESAAASLKEGQAFLGAGSKWS